MALTKTKLRNLTVGEFRDAPTRYPGQICEIRAVDTAIPGDTGSICHGWDQGGGVLVIGVMVTRSPEQQAPYTTANTADAAAATKRQNAITAVRAEVTAIKAIAAGSRTTTQRAFLGLAYLVFTEE